MAGVIPNFHTAERIVRGFSNHRRIEALELLGRIPELSVEGLAKHLHINYKTAAEHVRRLAISGLVMKRSDGHSIRHKLTARGSQVLKFLRTLK